MVAIFLYQTLNDLSHVVEDAVLDLITLVVGEMSKVLGEEGTADTLNICLSFDDFDDGRDFDDSRSGKDEH